MTTFARLACVAWVASSACARPVPPPAPPDHYRSGSAWLCLPDRPEDPCNHDLDTTVIDGNNARVVVPALRGRDAVDCFYLYGTVDLGLRPANHDDFRDVSRIASTTRAQVARFAQVCALYVPLYRQVTIGTYLRGGDVLAARLDLAYSDVASAFREYLATHNRGRRIVVLGHSQGGEMAKRLLVEFFDHDPALRARLVVAMPLGAHVEVPRGKHVGATFANLPACSALGETGCVIAFRSFPAHAVPEDPDAAIGPGNEEMCVHPGNLADPDAAAALDAVYPRNDVHAAGVTTPFVSFPALELGRCISRFSGVRVLGIEATAGPRADPIDLDSPWFRTPFGTHVLDFQIAQDNLIEIVRAAAERR